MYPTGKKLIAINNSCSVLLYINTGAPQGSILGPLFFILYNNDLLPQMPNIIMIC